jgi:hypothetical protein
VGGGKGFFKGNMYLYSFEEKKEKKKSPALLR